MIDEVLVLFTREVRKWVGRRPVLVVSLITPLFWILLFGKSFNITAIIDVPALNLPAGIAQSIIEALRERVYQIFGTRDYFTYVASGMLVVFALFQGTFSGIGVVFDRRLGYMTRLMVSPIRRESIFIAKVLATVFRITVLSSLLLLAAYIAGFEFKEGITVLDLLLAWTVLISIAVALSSIFITLGFMTDSHELLFSIGNLVNLPLMFTSSALFPTSQMPEWLRAIAHVNPLTYGADLVRFFLVGKPMDNAFLTLGAVVALSLLTFLVCMVISVRALERG
ncbi:MAG: ABC transporter permease [Acidilobaceae archaeon]